MADEEHEEVELRKPLFRIIAMDDPSCKFEGDSIEDVYREVYVAAMQCQQPAMVALRSQSGKEVTHRPRPPDASPSYGMTPYQFFGLGIQAIHKMIEELPGMAMVAIQGALPGKAKKGYRFCYTLPAEEELVQAQRRLENKRRQSKVTQQEPRCARTDAIQVFHEGPRSMTTNMVRVAEELDDPSRQEEGASGDPAQGHAGGGGWMKDNDKSIQSRYRILRSMPSDRKLVVRRSRIHGWGLFAKEAFNQDDMVVEYMGETVRACIADLREKKYEAEGMGSCYMFRLDKYEIVDATLKGNLARFINHSCQPTCYARVITIETGEKKIVMLAKRPIEAGEEVSYDYKFPIEDTKIACHCSAPNCVGSMN